MNVTTDAGTATITAAAVPRRFARMGAGFALTLAAAAIALAPAASATILASGTSCPQQGTLGACRHTGDYQGDFSQPVTAPSATEFPYGYLGEL